jgi:hypothetical protein
MKETTVNNRFYVALGVELKESTGRLYDFGAD